MARNKKNMRQMKEAVIEEHKLHYIDGVTTYRGVWRRWIQPKYFISYSYYMDILCTPQSEIKEKDDN